MLEKIKSVYAISLGVSLCISLLVMFAGVSNFVTSGIVFIFSTLVLVGACYVLGGLIMDLTRQPLSDYPVVFLVIGIVLVIGWLAILGGFEVLTALFLWEVGVVFKLAVISVMICLATAFHYRTK